MNKLGITYSLFDGEELLKYSIKQIRKSADYINVVYQKNHGLVMLQIKI